MSRSLVDAARSVSPYSALVNTQLFCIMLANEACGSELERISGKSCNFIKAELGAYPGTIHDLAAFYKRFGIFPGEASGCHSEQK